MPRFPGKFIVQIVECLDATVDRAKMELLSINLGIAHGFQKNTNATGRRTEQLLAYIKYLINEQLLFQFLEIYFAQQTMSGTPAPVVASLMRTFKSHFQKKASGGYKINDRVFQIIDVNYGSPFVGRGSLKKYLSKMVAGEAPPVLFVNGEEQTGKSYLGNYFSEVAGVVECFRFVRIDVRVDLEVEPGEPVQAAHIAKHIATALDMPGGYQQLRSDRFEDFKHQTFLTALERFLIKSKTAFFFFVDHLSYTHVSGRVRDILIGVANKLLSAPVPGFMVVIGMDAEGTEKLINEKRAVINPFTKADVKQYLQELYAWLQQKALPIPMDSEHEFMEFSLGYFPEDFFSNSNQSNVPIIGSRAKILVESLTDPILDPSNTDDSPDDDILNF